MCVRSLRFYGQYEFRFIIYRPLVHQEKVTDTHMPHINTHARTRHASKSILSNVSLVSLLRPTAGCDLREIYLIFKHLSDLLKTYSLAQRRCSFDICDSSIPLISTSIVSLKSMRLTFAIVKNALQ